MDFTFSEEQRMIRDMARKFVASEVKPLADRIDREEEIPKELIRKIAEQGFLGICFPEEYGGVAAGEIGYSIMLEEFSRACASVTTFIGAHVSIGVMSIYLTGSEEQKKRYLPSLCAGEKIAAFAITEPEAGSDASNIKTVAMKDGDSFLINGGKIYITNGGIADVIVIFANVSKEGGGRSGITAFIVETDTPGFRVVAEEEKMGIRGTSTAELRFEDMRVPEGNVLGRIGFGFLVAMKVLDIGRLSLAAGCLGAAKEALELSTSYAKQRVQFGKPIASNQAIQWMLADMATEIFAMESLVYRAAWMKDQGMKIGRVAAMAKLFCSEALDRIIDRAVQIHGGMGYIRKYPIERMYRDSRINRIFEGTNEIQRMIIAHDILKRGFKW
jgi:alkylation response protein AidB-like acyl-CoA dehydrogenase